MDDEIEHNRAKAPISPEDFESAALHEDWPAIDKALAAGAAEHVLLLGWAKQHLTSANENVRDAAVSVYEKAPRVPTDELMDKLREMRDGDEGEYVRIRSAFALFAHGDRTSQTIAMLRAALEDEDVAEIAQRYLEQFGNTK